MRPGPILLLSIAVTATGVLHAAQAPRAPDVIFHDGKIVTADSASAVAEAFAVSGDRFVAVGTNASVLALADKRTRMIDLAGATVIPGLTDSHDHLWNSAKFEFRGVDMIGVKSLAEMQARLRAAVAQAKPGETVFTTLGWNVRPRPTRADLDAVSTQTPIAIVSSRHGTGVVNTAALRRLGLSKANPLFKGVKVPVSKDGEPTGETPDYPPSLEMINTLLPPMTAQMQDAVIAKAMAKRNALGITSIRELSDWPEAVAGLQRMRREGKLTLRMALGLEFPDPAQTGKHLTELPAPRRDDPWLFVDCAGEEPWTPGTTALEPYTALVLEERRLGWRPAPHVSSDVARGVDYDKATDQTLAAYEAVDRESPLNGQRWYVEHVSFATPGQIDQMARLGLIVSVQHQGYDPPNPGPLPPERMARGNPIRELIDHKIVVIGGSDYISPTAPEQESDQPLAEREPDNLMIPFYFYVTRKTESGELAAPSEKISREEALRIFTTNAAYATFEEKTKGQIAPKMLADFVILNQDLMTVPDERILGTRALATFVGGREVYAAPGTHF